MPDADSNPFTAAVNAAGQVLTARQQTSSARNAADAASMAASEAARAAAADAAMRASMTGGTSPLLKFGLPALALGAVAIWWFFLRKKG